MLNVVCIQSGNYQGRGAEYVNILFDSIRRNLADGYEGRFICFTDDPANLDPGIEARPLPADLPGWWSKLALFRGDLFPAGERVVFFDLDTVITGRLDEILAYDGSFAILRDFYRPGGLQSAVMAWRAGDHAEIWESFVAAGMPQDDPGGDQAWIERTHMGVDRWQDLFPGLFVSYKLTRGIPAEASVVCFHGKPRPHEVDGWVPEVWKVGGLSRADLKAVCNTEAAKLVGNVRSACARDLPWFDFTYDAHDRHAVIVGGGPSLRDTLWEIKARRDLGQEVWALNNTAGFLLENGIVPDYHVIVDARPENAAFVRCHPNTVHLIGSQCDPAVFGTFTTGTKVVLWHANSPGMVEELASVRDKPVHLVGGGTTVGLHAVTLAFLSGYRKIHVYGFDSSYREGDHHAYAQTLNDADRVLDVLYNEQRFRAAPWMSGQAQEFLEIAQYFEESGTVLTVHGDGLLPTMFRDHQRFGLASPAEQRAQSVLSRIEGIENPVGAELGVFLGRMSACLLRREGLTLAMVDSWEGEGVAYADKGDDWHARLPQAAQDGYLQEALMRTGFAKDRRQVVRMRSHAAADQFPDGHFDFVFIDADHSYGGCQRDIAAWKSKVKPGGWLCGHDYRNTQMAFDGVDLAVEEFVKGSGLVLETGDNYTWFVRMDQVQERRAA